MDRIQFCHHIISPSSVSLSFTSLQDAAGDDVAVEQAHEESRLVGRRHPQDGASVAHLHVKVFGRKVLYKVFVVKFL